MNDSSASAVKMNRTDLKLTIASSDDQIAGKHSGKRMSSQTLEENSPAAGNFTPVMKQDWDERARENAKWYINTVRLDQSEEEFDATGLNEAKSLILPELVLMTEGRDPKELKFLEVGCGIGRDRKSTRLNSSHMSISYAVLCLK